jgi:hypothetical protein
MDIRFTCYQCRQKLAVDESSSGCEVTCPSCQTTLTVPYGPPKTFEPAALPRVPPSPPARRPWLRLAVLVIAVAVFGAWFYFQPHMTLYKLDQAAKANDTNGVSAHVDFPALRASLKEGFTQMMLKETASTNSVQEEKAAFRDALMATLVERMLEKAVTPESVARLLRGEANLPLCNKRRPEKSASSGTTSLAYRDWNTFVIEMKDSDPSEFLAELTLTRSGFSTWRVSGFRIPSMARSKA